MEQLPSDTALAAQSDNRLYGMQACSGVTANPLKTIHRILEGTARAAFRRLAGTETWAAVGRSRVHATFSAGRARHDDIGEQKSMADSVSIIFIAAARFPARTIYGSSIEDIAR